MMVPRSGVAFWIFVGLYVVMYAFAKFFRLKYLIDRDADDNKPTTLDLDK